MRKLNFLQTDLITRCKQNNAKAQMQLYDKYCDAMFAITMRYVRNSDDAEDVMQDAFIKAFAKINDYKGEVAFGAWLKRIVINQSLDWLKKQKVELVTISDEVLNYTNVDEIDWSLKDEIPVETILSEINNLKENYKTILNLYLLEGYDHQEIAEILNITEVNSRSLLMRGKSKLKSKLKNYNYA